MLLSLNDDSLDDVIKAMPQSVATPEIKIPIGEAEKHTFMQRFVAEATFEQGEKTTIDGLRVDFAKGCGLVRASNTSPVLTLRFEGDSEAVIAKLKALFKEQLKAVDKTLTLDF